MPQSNIWYYEFGRYRLDPLQRVLTRDGEALSLTPKATEILLLLVMNAGQLIGREELLKEVWADTFVEESNLTQTIFTLRQAFKEHGNGTKFIETVSRRGYRFVAPVKAVSRIEQYDIQRGQNSANQSVGAEPVQLVLAVLPFMNVTGDLDSDSLADGITESVINNLSRIAKLRVMSHSAVGRYKGTPVDPTRFGQELGVHWVLVGKVHSVSPGVLVSAELVDVANGWQLWSESYEHLSDDLSESKNEISCQLSATLAMRLTPDSDKPLTKRYTDNSDAYHAYIAGRHQWSKYTRDGVERAIVHFRRALDLDPNYALAYAGIVDCYLRLATNYLPPEVTTSFEQDGGDPSARDDISSNPELAEEKVRLRHEWDWKGAERELRRANELKSNYPAAHQWHAAYALSVKLWQKSAARSQQPSSLRRLVKDPSLLKPRNIPYSYLMPDEGVQVLCTIAREQIDVGNFEAACLVLSQWWKLGEWPKLNGLTPQSSADLLFTAGVLAGCVASTRQVPKGQKHGEALLNGSLGLCEQLGLGVRTAEVRIELASCYYRQGLFDLARETLLIALQTLSQEQCDLKSLGLFRLGIVERHAGRRRDSYALLNETARVTERESGPWVSGRYYQELATTLKDLGIAEKREDYFEQAIEILHKALYEFEAIGNHRYSAVVENNYGYLLLYLSRFDEAENHLLRARKLFDAFDDKLRRAQVDDTLAQLYLATERVQLAACAVERAVQTLEAGDEDALLAEALITKGMIFCKLDRHNEGKRVLQDSHRVAERCGDTEGAGRALLILLEEMCEHLEDKERQTLAKQLTKLLANSQQGAIRERLSQCLRHISKTHPS